MFRIHIIALVCLFSLSASAEKYSEIAILRDAHPAVRSAAEMLAKSLSLPPGRIRSSANLVNPHPGQIVLVVSPGPSALKRTVGDAAHAVEKDGYVVVFTHGGALIYGARPRSLLYAAADVRLWRNSSDTFVRNPAFAIRTGQYDPSRSVAEFVAQLGVNAIIMRREGAVVTLKDTLPEVFRQLRPEVQARVQEQQAQAIRENQEFVKLCHDADVPVYAFLYGNDFHVWSPALYEAAVQVFPSAKGTSIPHSHEKNTLTPADPATWKLFHAYITELMRVTGADGLYATFWDRYGIYCTDDRCLQAGVATFRDQLFECVKQYYEAVHGLGKKLVVRTWASGSPHWLGENYVHAPGYGVFGGTEEEVWGRVIRELPADIVIQTKAYYSDCEPDARFSPLIGHAAPHAQIVEYQVSGQFVGRFYFPASSVNHMFATMKQARQLAGADGGVNIFPGGTRQTDYSVFDDILNSINVFAWRELSWNPDADVNQIWQEWASTVYAPEAVPHVVKALKLSEEVVNRTFSTLGLGSSTNSDYAGSIARRETLLRYTNRYYLPEYAELLEPTKENIQRVVEDKKRVAAEIDEMQSEFTAAKPFLTPAQSQEWGTRLDWMRQFATINNELDESLWRYRYLHHLDTMLTTDPEQLRAVAAALDDVQQRARLLFRYDPSQKFSCYSVTLGALRTKPSLGDPVPLMRELYTKSRELVEQSVGPDYLSGEPRR